MAASLVRTARTHGIDPAGVDLISQAHALAMGPRVAALNDEDHPLFLHPGRTALVLMQDAGVTDATLLAAAVLTESEDVELQADLTSLPGALAAEVADLVGAVPPSGDHALAERLVDAGEEVCLIATAERLDHLRHAHLREDPAWRARAHAEAVAVYGPIAERTHEGLAARYRYWIRMFERRFLDG